MNNETPINVDGSPDLMGKAGQLLHAMRELETRTLAMFISLKMITLHCSVFKDLLHRFNATSYIDYHVIKFMSTTF